MSVAGTIAAPAERVKARVAAEEGARGDLIFCSRGKGEFVRCISNSCRFETSSYLGRQHLVLPRRPQTGAA